jgi:beta-lactamase regulating signal transducer with metallopeptidase domain
MSSLAEALSTALLHFIWQGLAVASLLWVALGLMRFRSANARYVMSCAALAVQASLPVLTALLLYSNPPARHITGEAHSLPVRLVLITPSTSIDWKSWALPLWSVGVLFFSARLAWGCFQVSALRRRAKPADNALRTTVSGVANRMGLERRIRVLTASLPDGPSVIGWIRPIILLPAATIAGLTPEQLEMVLAHELAHIRRFDYLVNLGQMLIETLLFYHPAVWWVSQRIRQERELACDDAAVKVCGNPIAYARALTALERLRSETPLVAMGAASRPLLDRIQRLTGTGSRDTSTPWAGILAICATLACLILNVDGARAQTPAPSPQPAPTSVARPTPQAPAVKKARATRKKIQAPALPPREDNPWLKQIIVYKPAPPEPDPLPADLSKAMKDAAYASGWEYGYLRIMSPWDNQRSEANKATTEDLAQSMDINKDLGWLRTEAASAPSPEAREKIYAQLRALVDKLNAINERLREARHAEGETRDAPIQW